LGEGVRSRRGSA